MIMLVLVLTVLKVTVGSPIDCWETYCPSFYISDDYCDSYCMIPECNYDSSDYESTQVRDKFKSSDCFNQCMSEGCNFEKLADGVCDTECNTSSCGYDLGDCGYCASGCTLEMLGDGVQNPECNTLACRFDGNDIGWCAEGCFKENLEDEECQEACNNYDCNYDSLFCDDDFCAPGCSPSMQSDYYCHEECNNAECEYQYGVCLCNPGCTPEKLEETECYEDDPCNTWECEFKNGICGYCAFGCFEEQIGDGNCNDSCNVWECDYDFGDCGCAPGCEANPKDGTWDEQGCQILECMVDECYYNVGSCSKNLTIVKHIYSNILNSQPFDSYSCHSYTSCTYQDLSSHYRQEYEKCKSDDDICGGPDCLYCMGNYEGCPENCEACTDSGQCLKCTGYQIRDLCLKSDFCPPGYGLLEEITGQRNIEDWNYCFPKIDESSKNSPEVVYVEPIDSDPVPGGLGTQEYPYYSLSYAFAQLWKAYNKVVLKEGKIYYVQHEIDQYENELFVDGTTPFERSAGSTIKKVTIESENPENPSVILFYENKLGLKFNIDLVFKNVIIAGNEGIDKIDCEYGTAYDKSCSQKTCEYCPYLESIYSGGETLYRNDRDQFFDCEEIEGYGIDCDQNHESIVIEVEEQGSLEMDNSSIRDFRKQYKYLIYSKSNVTLTNFDLYNVMAATNDDAAIIKIEKKDSERVNFTYNSGKVQLVNNGYEYSSSLTSSLFSHFVSVDYITFNNVEFSYNMIIDALSQDVRTSLIYIEKNTGKTLIENCKFENILTKKLIYVDSRSFYYSGNLEIDSSGNSLAYSKQHLEIRNSTFKNILSFGDLISYLMSTEVQNLKFENLEFEGLVSEGSLILVQNTKPIGQQELYGQEVQTKSDGKEIKYYVSKRKLELLNLTFSDIQFSGGMISIEKMPNILLENVKISDSSDSDNTKANNIVQNLSDSEEVYLESLLDSLNLPILTCTSTIDIPSPYILNIVNLELESVTCSQSSTATFGLSIQNSGHEVSIQDARFYELNGITSSASILNLQRLTGNVSVSDISLKHSENQLASLIVFNYLTNVTVSKFEALDATSGFNGVFELTEVTLARFDELKCDTCVSSYGNGAGIYFKASASQTTIPSLNIMSSVFRNCLAEEGGGGAVYIDSESTFIPMNISISNITIENSSASYGTAFHISNSVSFDSAKLTDSKFSGLKASRGAPISDNHYSGTFEVSGIEVSNITGMYCFIRGSYSTEEVNLDISRAFFDKCLCTKAILNFESWESTSRVQLTDMQVANSYQGIRVEGMALIASSLEFRNCSKALTAVEGGYLSAENLLFEENKDVSVSVHTDSTVECSGCTFLKNSGSSSLFVDKDSKVNLTECTFEGNSVDRTGSVAIFQTNQQFSEIRNSVIKNNNAADGYTMYLQNSKLKLSNCSFKSNTANKMSPGVLLSSSELIVENSEFSEQTGDSGSFIIPNSLSEVEIRSSSFSQGTAKDSGGAISSSSSTVKVYESAFKDLQAASGGSVYGSSSDITLVDCSIKNSYAGSRGGSVYLDGGKLLLENVDLENSDSTAVFLENLEQVEAKNSVFKNCKGTDGGAFYTNLVDKLFFSDLSFRNNQAENSGGAVYLKSSPKEGCLIQDSYFYNNSAVTGGGLSGVDVSLNLTRCFFESNNASDIGGGVSLTCPSDSSCKSHVRDSNFTLNSASTQGGSLKWDHSRPSFTNLLFQNNSAAYGADMASFPVLMSPQTSSSTRLLASYVGEINGIAPGQTTTSPIILAITDDQGNIVSIDNTSTATLSTTNPDVAISGLTQVTAVNGVFTFDSFIISGVPKTNVTIQITTTAVDESKAKVASVESEFSSAVEYLVFLRDCIPGEENKGKECFLCESGTYSLDPSIPCQECPLNKAYCLGGMEMYPRPNYWRAFNDTDVFYQCPNKDACLGSPDHRNPFGNCEEGYTGHMCQSCKNGYSRSSENTCGVCPEPAVNVIRLLGIGIGVFIGCCFLVKTTISSAHYPKALHSIYIKIFTNYIQLVYLTTQFNLAWPDFVLEMFDYQKSAATVSDQVFSVDCYLESEDEDQAGEEVLFKKLLIMAFLPFIAWGFAFMVWTIAGFMRDKRIHSRKEVLLSIYKNELVTTMIILFFLVHPNIVKLMFSVFSCREIEGKDYWLIENLDTQCWDEKHTFYAFAVALPCIIVWGLGTPTFIMFVMYRNRRDLTKISFKVKYGFIFNGYRAPCFFWEFFIMYRKIAVICLAVFFSTISVPVQALTCLFILLISFDLQKRFKPFKVDHLNEMEERAVLTATLTIFCGLYYLTDHLEEPTKIFFFVVMVTVNVYFLSYWLFHMCNALKSLAIQKIPFLRARFGVTDGFQGEFYVEDKKITSAYFEDNIWRATLLKEKTPRKLEQLEVRDMVSLWKHILNSDPDPKGDYEDSVFEEPLSTNRELS